MNLAEFNGTYAQASEHIAQVSLPKGRYIRDHKPRTLLKTVRRCQALAANETKKATLIWVSSKGQLTCCLKRAICLRNHSCIKRRPFSGPVLVDKGHTACYGVLPEQSFTGKPSQDSSKKLIYINTLCPEDRAVLTASYIPGLINKP